MDIPSTGIRSALQGEGETVDGHLRRLKGAGRIPSAAKPLSLEASVGRFLPFLFDVFGMQLISGRSYKVCLFCRSTTYIGHSAILVKPIFSAILTEPKLSLKQCQ